MSDIVVQASSLNGIVSSPRALPDTGVRVRAGTMEDLAFIDALQRKTTKQVGFMPRAQFEGKIRAGHVLVAEGGVGSCQLVVGGEDTGSARPTTNQQLPTRLGYLIGNDQYFKRDDVGIIYQINVVPEMRRSLVAAMLLKAQFERSAYGCRLYCCWCAQDIEANRFWEAMGFVPLAFRAGSEKKARVHIFWQKRIRSGDVTTPWWFPSKTAGGSIREDRIVLPIPPGTRWSDAKPMILPGAAVSEEAVTASALPEAERAPVRASVRKAKPVAVAAPVRRNGLMFDIPQPGEALAEAEAAKRPKAKAERVKRACDPRLVAAARELRDRWLEEVNGGRYVLGSAGAKYDVTRRALGDENREESALPVAKLLAA